MGYESEVLSDGPVVWLPNGKKAENRPMELTEFFLARIAEDEAAASAASSPHTWTLAAGTNGWLEVHGASHTARTYVTQIERAADALHVQRHDPARVLAECEAKRQIVERAGGVEVGYPSYHLAQGMMSLLALPYADHPDYRDEWKPEGSAGEPWYTKHLPADDAEAAAQAEARKRGGRD